MTARVRMTKHQQLQVCFKHDERNDWSYNDLAKWAFDEFSLPKRPSKPSILKILRTKEQLFKLSADCLAKKELRSPYMLKLDEAVVEFTINAELSKIPTSGTLVLAMARRFANKLKIPVQHRPLFARTGWLRHFMARYNFRRKRAHGEIGSVDLVEARKQLDHLHEQVGQFHPSDVYDMDETALFFKATPRTSIVLNEAPALKQDKSRVTMVVGANADGSDKLPLLFIGKAENPRWLKDKPDTVQYVGTSKGCMTVAVYQEWLKNLNEKMKDANRSILLLVDNAPVHIHRDMSLTNVAILKLPPNTTSLLQPMDQGVTACLKHGFMTLRTDAAVDLFLDGDENPFRVSLLEGIEWCEESWSNVQANVIKNCWRHAVHRRSSRKRKKRRKRSGASAVFAMEPPPRVRAYDPTTDTTVYEDTIEAAAPSAPAEPQIQTEFVDVYLLSPEDDRGIELKDFTIMKPKNNKMHRLVRYFPRCEISYTAAPPPPPPEEKLVTSPRGTTTVLTTTAHRHNGGFSNPSRNAEVFRLKRRLLNEYFASINSDLEYAGGAAMYDGAGSSNPHYSQYSTGGSGYSGSFLQRSYKRPGSPSSVSSDAHVPPPPLPKYKRVKVGDEESIPLTSERVRPMSLKARIRYIDSLWPGIAPVDDDDDVMDYYGLEVEIISEEEREKELKEAAAAAANASPDGATTAASEGQSQPSTSSPDKKPAVGLDTKSPEKTNGGISVIISPQKSEGEDPDDEFPEMTVETRSAALQKMKDAEKKVSPVASKQDDWVQCDKCQKWRRLPNHVNVSELPATWYCKMNRWDKRFNKCSIPEEKIAVLMKESDLVEYRERKFALDFLHRIKRMEKTLVQYKYTDNRDDDGERKYVQCIECLKKRPLLGGMDPSKITQPFVCWMNWDELHASCSAPQGALPSRDFDSLNGGGTVANSHGADESAEKSTKKSSSKASGSKNQGESGSGGKQDAVSSGSSKKPSKSSNASGSINSNAKRKPTAAQGSGAAEKSTSSGANNGSSSHAKKPKRR